MPTELELDHYGKCPKCSANWDGGEIPEEHREHYAPPYKFSRLIGIEYPHRYDGVWEWECPDCSERFPRFAKGVRA